MRLLAGLLLIAAAPAFAADEVPPPAAAVALLGPASNVSDLAAAQRFYVEGLGMKQLMQMGQPRRYETMLGFAADPRQPGLILMSDKTATKRIAKTHGTGFDRLVFRIADLPGVAARLKSMGYQVSAVREVAMGYRMAMATDPDGYRLELVETMAKTKGQ